MDKFWKLTSIVSSIGFLIMIILWVLDVWSFSVVSGDTFISIIVTLLAIAVAIVIGFQISNALELKRKIETLDIKIIKLDLLEFNINKTLAELVSDNMILYATKQFENNEFLLACDNYYDVVNNRLQYANNSETYMRLMRDLTDLAGRISIYISEAKFLHFEEYKDWERNREISMTNMLNSSNYHLIKPYFEIIDNAIVFIAKMDKVNDNRPALLAHLAKLDKVYTILEMSANE